MYENQTFEAIMRRVLSRVPSNLDKREGSVIWDATSPVSVEHAIIYTALDFIMRASFADSAPREYLIRRSAERGLIPYPATNAVFRGEFNIQVPIGSRYSLGSLNYIVTERMPQDDTPQAFSYRVRCEAFGTVGNAFFGLLTPIAYIDGLTRAELVELLIPGADDEETEAFRQRFFDSLRSQAFGGNQADYKDKVLSIAGVGAVRVYPTWNADLKPADLIPNDAVSEWYLTNLNSLPAEVKAWLKAMYEASNQRLLTVGGSVKLLIMNSLYGVPSGELLDDVKQAIAPDNTQGEGLGIAPIGHVVHVVGVESMPINIALTLQYQASWDWEAVQSYVNDAIDDYFLELAKAWQDGDPIIIRVSQIESRILGCPGIADISDTLINGSHENITLDDLNIPIRGGVIG